MKKLLFFIVLLAVSNCLKAQELKSEFLFDLQIDLDRQQAIGPVLKGTRVIFPFKGGDIKGNTITGKILECSGEWGLVVDSTTFKMDCRVTVQTDEGALIYIAYTGYNYVAPPKNAIMNAGKGYELSPSDYYFRSTPVFETSSPKYAWLNHTIAVGVGRFVGPGKLVYKIYAIK
ncbi:DUF3237 domain-containing protein [Chitinophaga sp. Hz27]|uniref:DUF3237 domain-containing protein n=1 Tax=Chitinophaga sp. Hz27 TaxID=3347169 RepID=UPI0035DE7C78